MLWCFLKNADNILIHFRDALGLVAQYTYSSPMSGDFGL